MMFAIFILSLIGLTISVYGIIVERKIQQDALYKPSYDISDTISCSRAFLSPYGKIFGISNIWISAFYYATLAIMSITPYDNIIFFIIILGLLVSIVFAYILYFKVRSACPICISLYLVNVLLIIFYYFK